MPRIIAPATPEFAGYTGVHPTNKGGFGASTEAGIIANIGGINKNDTSTGGIVQIGEDGVATGMEEVTVIADFTTIFGPDYFNYTSATKYEITSYTPFKTYNAYIKELPDTEVIVQDEFIFVPSGIELDTVTLVVNGREIQIDRIPSGISEPKVTIVGFRDAAKDYLKVTAEGYSSEYGMTLQSVHVQVSTTPNFSAIVVDKIVGSTDAVAGIAIELTKSTSYYVRTRFLDSSGRWGEWTISPGVSAANLPNNIATPIVSSEGHTSETRVGFDIKSTAGFSKPGVTHASTSWQISTNVGFTALVVNNANNTVNKESYSTEIENSSEIFYIRARHTNSASQTSAWSNVVVISRSDLFNKFSFILDQIQYGENASLAPGGTARWIDNDTFVSNNNMSAVGRDNIGRILVNKRIDGKWKCVQVIEEPLHPEGPSTRTANFGACIELSTNKRWLCVSITRYTDANHNGAVAIYENVGGTLVFNSIVRYPFSTTTDFSNGIYISDDGNELLIGAPKHTVNGFLDAGAVIHCKKVNDTWTFNILNIGTPYTSRSLGYRIHLSSDGTKIFVGSYNWVSTYNNITHYILKRSSDTFVIDSEIVSPTPATHKVKSTGWAYAMDPSMDVVILTTRDRYDSNNAALQGYIDVFERVNNTYTLKQRIFSNFTGTNILGQRIQGDRDLTYFIATVHSATTNDYGFIFSKVDGQWTAVAKLTIDGIESIFSGTTLRGGSLLLRSDGKEVIIGGTSAPVGYGSNISFKRQTEKYQIREKLEPVVQGTNGYFGEIIVMSDDGVRIAVVDRNPVANTTALGTTYVFRKENGQWIKEFELGFIKATGLVYNANAVSISRDGTKLAISTNTYEPDGYAAGFNTGVVFIYERVDTTWTLKATLVENAKLTGANLGTWLGEFSGDGNRFFTYVAKTGGSFDFSGGGYAVVFKRTGGVWAQESIIAPPATGYNYRFGRTLQVSADGTMAIITATDSTGYLLEAYYYKHNGTAWAMVQALSLPSKNGDFASNRSAVSANSAFTVVAVSNGRYDSDRGATFIYRRSGDVWTMDPIIFTVNGRNVRESGYDVKISDDGNRLVIRNQGVAFGSGSTGIFFIGSVQIYDYINSKWVLKKTIRDAYDYQDGIPGWKIAGDKDLNQIAVANRRQSTATVKNAGAVYFYK